MTPPALVIGYGNPLRGDDGAGPAVARLLEARLNPSRARASALRAMVLICHQLTPELAEPVSRASRVVFADASADGTPGEWRRTPAREAGNASGAVTHHTGPELVLEYARALYGAEPEAWLYTMAGADFDTPDALSPPVQRAVAEAAAAIERYLSE